MNTKQLPVAVSLNPGSTQRSCPTVAVVADGQNVHLWKTGDAILRFASTLGMLSIQWAYYNWRNLKPLRESRLQDQGWQCVDIAVCTKNELDRRMMADCRKLCAAQPPDTLVLVTNDGDFAPLVKELLERGIQVIVIGRRNGINKQFKRLLPSGIIYIEDLQQQLPLAS